MPQRRQRSPSKCRPRNKEVAISRSRLDEDAILVCCGRKMKIVYVCGYRYQVSPESCPPPCFLPREPPGQAMAIVACGCCRRRVMWRQRAYVPSRAPLPQSHVSPKSPYPREPPVKYLINPSTNRVFAIKIIQSIIQSNLKKARFIPASL